MTRWKHHVQQYYESHPHMTFKEVLQAARLTYQSSSYGIPRPLPKKEPLLYISSNQASIINKNEKLKKLFQNTQLPAWMEAREIGKALGFGTSGVDRAQTSLGGSIYLWATEFENVHSFWTFAEPEIHVDGKKYRNSEEYFHAMKPKPFDPVTGGIHGFMEPCDCGEILRGQGHQQPIRPVATLRAKYIFSGRRLTVRSVSGGH